VAAAKTTRKAVSERAVLERPKRKPSRASTGTAWTRANGLSIEGKGQYPQKISWGGKKELETSYDHLRTQPWGNGATFRYDVFRNTFVDHYKIGRTKGGADGKRVYTSKTGSTFEIYVDTKNFLSAMRSPEKIRDLILKTLKKPAGNDYQWGVHVLYTLFAAGYVKCFKTQPKDRIPPWWWREYKKRKQQSEAGAEKLWDQYKRQREAKGERKRQKREKKRQQKLQDADEDESG
jgi:hypothetical protein